MIILELFSAHPGGSSGGNLRPQAGFLRSLITHPPMRHITSHNDIHNNLFSLLIFIKRSSFYATSTSQSSSRLKKPVKHLQSAPELHWLKFTQNDFF